jgi:hypothetical protein
MSTATAEPAPFCSLSADGRHLDFRPHPGQKRALDSPKRFVLVLAGSQSGKSSVGVLWLWEEIGRRGAGDYLCVAPSYPLMQKKMLPEFLRLFQTYKRSGEYKSSERTFHFRDGVTKVFFGHADDPESLEAATVKAAWLDEAGQRRFRFGSWEAIQRRLAVHCGRCLLTTTPYDLGWLKQRLYDPWLKAGRDHPDIDVINFESTMNPTFPRAEFERARGSMPAWRFNMFFRGIFEKPAGLIYDCFTDQLNTCPRFTVPPAWRRHLGLDFGGVNTAGVFFARDPAADPPRYYAYREYLAGGRTAKEHAAELLRGEPGVPVCVGGSKSEGQWRSEFQAAGLPVQPPAITDVEVGIDRCYGGFKSGQVIVFDDLAGLLDEINSYSRPVDEAGEPTEGIQDKESFHRADAVRYIMSWLLRGSGGTIGLPGKDQRTLVTLPTRR